MNKIRFLLLIGMAIAFISCAQENTSDELPVKRIPSETAKLNKQGIQLNITEITDTTIAGVGDKVKIEIDVVNNKQNGVIEISGHREYRDSVSIRGNKIVIFREVTSVNDSLFKGTVNCRKDNRVQSKVDFEISYPTRELRIKLVNLTSEKYVLNQSNMISVEVERYKDIMLSASGGTIYKRGRNWEFIPTLDNGVKLSLAVKKSDGMSFLLHRWELDVKAQ